MPSRKTPEERSEVVRKREAAARKGYKKNLKKRVNVTPEELIIIKDMVVSLKLVGYSNSQIAAIVGLSKGQTRELINEPNFQKRLAAISKKLPEAAFQLGQAYLVESVQNVMHIQRTETDNALVLKAAAEMFDRFGIPKLSRTEVKTDPTPEGTDTELDETTMDKLRRATPEIQEKVAQLHGSFSEGVERILNGGDLADSET